MDSHFNFITLRFLFIVFMLLFSSFSSSKVFAFIDQQVKRTSRGYYIASGYATTGAKSLSITPEGLRTISNLQGAFYPYQAQGKWIIIVGHSQSLYIGKPSKDYINQIPLTPSEKAVVWLGVINPALIAKIQGNAAAGISYSPAYAIYRESVTAQMYNSKSAVDYLFAAIDLGLMLMAIGAAFWSEEALTAPSYSLRATSESEASIYKPIRGKIYDGLVNLLNKLKVGPESQLGQKAISLWNRWVEFFDAASKRALLARLALVAGGYEAYKHFLQTRLLQMAGSNIQKALNVSLFAYATYDRPAILEANKIYHASSTSKIPFLGSKEEKLTTEKLEYKTNRIEKIISDYLLHIPGLEARIERFFRSAGPRYTLLYTFDQGVLRVNYSPVPEIKFEARNLNVISRSTFSTFLDDKGFDKLLEELSKDLKDKYDISIDPLSFGKAFYTTPVYLPNSYFNQFTSSGSEKVVRTLIEKPYMSPAEAIYYAPLNKDHDYLTHSPSIWNRIMYGALAGASYTGAVIAGAAGVSVILAAASVAAALTGVGLVVIAAGLVIAGTYMTKSAAESWEISNMVLVPTSSTTLDLTNGDRVQDRAAMVCIHIYSLIAKIQGKNESDAIEKCLGFGEKVRSSLSSLVAQLANSPLAPVLKALHVDLGNLHQQLTKESYPLTLDWYYYYPADVVYVPNVTNGTIYLTCLDNISCYETSVKLINELKKAKS